MKKISLLLILFLPALPLLGQAPKTSSNPPGKAKPVSPMTDYAGDWAATFEGRVWLRLRLVLQDDKLTGAMTHARSVSLNDAGELKSVSEEESGEIVTDAVLNPDGLLLTVKDKDSQETSRYLMRLVLPAKQAADLKLIGQAMPPGMAKPKPWRLEKAGGTASSSPK